MCFLKGRGFESCLWYNFDFMKGIDMSMVSEMLANSLNEQIEMIVKLLQDAITDAEGSYVYISDYEQAIKNVNGVIDEQIHFTE